MKECTFDFLLEVAEDLYMKFRKISDYTLHILDDDKEVLALSYLKAEGSSSNLYSIQSNYGNIYVNPSEFDYTYLKHIEDGTIIKLPTEHSVLPKGYKYEKEILN